MRVVIDTNILVSALIAPAGKPAAIIDAWLDGKFTLLTCAMHVDEGRTTSRLFIPMNSFVAIDGLRFGCQPITFTSANSKAQPRQPKGRSQQGGVNPGLSPSSSGSYLDRKMSHAVLRGRGRIRGRGTRRAVV